MFQKNVSLKNYTTFKIGGKAKYFFTAKTKEDLVKAIAAAKELKLPFFILGGGGNILVSDQGFKGIVIKIENTKYKIQNAKMIAEAGMPLGELTNILIKKGLSGLEWIVGIPGTVGGAVYGNAGAFGKSMEDVVREVEVLDSKNLKIKKIKIKDCKFTYRSSIFKYKKNLIVLSTKLRFKKRKKKEIENKIKKYLEYKKKNHPRDYFSAGSIFKNPIGQFAGELIEKAGLKGKRIGKAKISAEHANFIVNLGGASAKDVKKLINLAKKSVKKKFKINLEEEIQFL